MTSRRPCSSRSSAPPASRPATPSTPGFNELAFNLGAATVDNKAIGDGHPALKDKRVRIAIDHAIDRKTLVDRVLRNHGTAATGVIPPIYPNWHWTPGANERAFDLARANSLLDQAGYARGSDGIRVGPDGRKLEFRLFGRENSETSKDNVEYIRGWLNDIGIRVTVSIMTEDQLTVVVGEGKYDMFEWGWVVEPDPDFQLSVFTCGQRSTEDAGEISAGWSDSFYCNPAYDALYEQQKTILDAPARAAVIKQAQQMLYDDAVYSMLFYYTNFEAYRSDKFTGFKPQPSDGGSLVFQYGTHSYRNIQPVSQESSDGGGSRLWIVLGVTVGVLAIGGLAFGLFAHASPILGGRAGVGVSIDRLRPRRPRPERPRGGAPARRPWPISPLQVLRKILTALRDARVRGRHQLLPVPGDPR